MSHQGELLKLLQFPMGLRFAQFEGRPRPVLLVKVTKECILAAKLNKGFKVYIVPVESNGLRTACLVSAFFDDEDEPLTLTTPLFDESEELWLGLWGGPFDVHFFNELNQEMLGYTTEVDIPEEIWRLWGETKLLPFDFGLAREMHEEATAFMSGRDTSDEWQALDVRHIEPIFPEGIFFLDVRPHMNAYQGSPGFRHTTLERDEPGPLQELDIVTLLRRVFPSEEIYHGPLRVTDGEEIADVVVVTPTRLLLIQAKDSPNTEVVLGNTLARKKATSIKRLTKAARQAKGAVGYARSDSAVLRMRVGGSEVQVSMTGRSVFSLLVVKELFNDMVASSDPVILELATSSATPCVALDYPELAQYTSHLAGEEAFFGALHRVYDFGMANGTFPRLRLGLIQPDDFDADDDLAG
jgi:hypothetical protein